MNIKTNCWLIGFQSRYAGLPADVPNLKQKQYRKVSGKGPNKKRSRKFHNFLILEEFINWWRGYWDCGEEYGNGGEYNRKMKHNRLQSIVEYVIDLYRM